MFLWIDLDDTASFEICWERVSRLEPDMKLNIVIDTSSPYQPVSMSSSANYRQQRLRSYPSQASNFITVNSSVRAAIASISMLKLPGNLPPRTAVLAGLKFGSMAA